MGGGFVTSRYQSPNLKAWAQQTVEEILFSMVPPPMKKGVTLVKAYPHVKVGDALGRVTASGKYRRYTNCYLHGAAGAGDYTFICEDGHTNVIEPPFVVGEIVSVGAQASKTITAINYATGVVTIATTVGGVVADHALVKLTTDIGTQVCVGFAGHPVAQANFNPESPNDLQVLDVDYQIDMILSGWLVKTKLRGYDTTMLTDLPAAWLYTTTGFDCLHVR